MGESAGIPFSGRTGWNAVTQYCPEGGKIFVMYQSHVGIDKKGDIGFFDGRDCCRAASQAYESACSKRNAFHFSPKITSHIHTSPKMECMKHLLAPHIHDIRNAENQKVELAKKMYHIVGNALTDTIHLDWMDDSSELVLIGGISINMEEAEDWFLPMKFEVVSQHERQDLMQVMNGQSCKI